MLAAMGRIKPEITGKLPGFWSPSAGLLGFAHLQPELRVDAIISVSTYEADVSYLSTALH
jgi:hypothetical protein